MDVARASEIYNSSIRMDIYFYARDNPGVHFRGICRGLGLPVGVVQYHLGVLTGAGWLTSRRERRYRRYFESGRFSEAEMRLISALRNETARRIISALSEKDSVPHSELASSLGVSSQALTWQMKRLKALGLVEAEAESRRVVYSLSEEKLTAVSGCLDLLNALRTA